MTSAGRTLGIVLGAVLLLGVLAAGGGYYWWQTQGLELKARAEAGIAEAAEFGRSTSSQGCLEEALRRSDRCGDGFTCNVVNNGFFFQCLRASSPVAGFCDGVPARDSIAESIVWRLNQCDRPGRVGTHCGNLFGQLQKYCDPLSPEPAS